MIQHQGGITDIRAYVDRRDVLISFRFEGGEYIFDPMKRLYELIITAQRVLELLSIWQGKAMAAISDVGYITEPWGEFTIEGDREKEEMSVRQSLDHVMGQIMKLRTIAKSITKENHIAIESALREVLIELVFEPAFSEKPDYLLRRDTISVKACPN